MTARSRPYKNLVALLAIIFGQMFMARLPARAISHGINASNLYGQVQLWIDDIDECGGTLINAEWVLTAKHCIVDNGGTIDNTYLLIDDLRLGSGELYTINRIYLNPTDDVALLHFVDPTSQLNLVFPYGVVRPSTGQSLLIQGWGYNENGPLQLGDPLQASHHSVIQHTPDPSIDPDPIYGPIGDYIVARSVFGLIEEGDSGSGVLTQGLVCGVVHGSNAPDPLSFSISTEVTLGLASLNKVTALSSARICRHLDYRWNL